MFEVFTRKFYSFVVLIALLLSVQIGLPSVAQASELSLGQASASNHQGASWHSIQSTSAPVFLAEAAVEAPAVDEAATEATEEAAKAEAKKVKEAEKAAKKAAKAEAKKLEEEQEAAEEAAKAEAKAAKKAAKEAAKKAKAAAAEQAIAPGSNPQTQLADATETPAAEDFASMTPEQKKQYFMKKGTAFKPTPEAIAEKVNKGMKMKGASMPPEVSEKINAKMKGKESFIPTPESISKKISEGMKMAKNKLEEVMNE